MHTQFACSTFVGLTACVLTAHAQPPTSYRLTQIGPVPENGIGITFVSDINAKGELIASVVGTSGGLQVNLWRNGDMTLIGETMDGRALNPGLNDRSTVAATLFDPSTGSHEAFRWRRGTLQALGSPSATSAFFAFDINDAGQVLGHTFDDASFTSQTYLRERDGTFVLLEPLPGAFRTFPVQLNKRGVATGFVETLSEERIFVDCAIWRDGTVEKLDTGSDGFCTPGGINDRNQVVGLAALNGMTRGFIWADGHTEALPFLHPGSDLANSAGGINNKGWIVGVTFDSQAGARATLWRRGRAYDLNTLVAADDELRPFVTLYQADLINDRGWIIALGLDSRRQGGGSSPYLLRPIH
jgi:uncharacterized membrane protein